MTGRHRASAAALAAVGLLAAGCSTSDEPEELTAHITIHVQKTPKSPEKTAVLICPGRKPIERDVCAALDVVAPGVFQKVGESRVCTMIYGGPATATMDEAPAQSYEYVTVVAGQSLWAVASEIAPTADPRDVVAEILSFNGMSSAELFPGQRLALPPQYS